LSSPHLQWCTDGDWATTEKLVQKTPLKDHKHFLYTVYKQQYLELIEQHEHQKVLFLPSASRADIFGGMLQTCLMG
jgi:hypothetical protein